MVLKIIVALVLLAHGIGHSMGILQVLKVVTINPAWDGRFHGSFAEWPGAPSLK